MNYTYKDELLLTPERIRAAIAEAEDPILKNAGKLIFCGCGTSFYMAGQCAKLCAAQGRSASAVDAVELLAGAAQPHAESTYVFISRSGNSEETVRAQSVVREAGAHSFYLGCALDSRLATACNGVRILPYGSETLILESYSFYVQLTAALRCCGIPMESRLPEIIAEALDNGERCFSSWLKGRHISRSISLSSPFYRPLHREMMLKDGEITQLPSEEWGILEFRHGPRCWCSETTLIHFISEERTRGWDLKAARELIGYGCPLIWYGKDPPDGCYSISFDVSHRSAAETLAYAAFHTGLAVEIGRELNTCPERLKHIVHNVGEL